MIKLIELKIAVRSLVANSRRTMLTLFITILGLFSTLFIAGYINRVAIGFGELLINEKYAHFQIYKKGFLALDNPTAMSHLLSDDDIEKIETILDREEVDFILPRMNLRGMAENLESGISKLFIGYGTDPFGESFMQYGQIVDGFKLSEDEPASAVFGTGLANKLEASLGDLVQIMIPTEGGGVEAELIRVDGIANYGPWEINDVTLMTSLDIAKSVNLTDSTQSLLVKLYETEDVETVYADFSEAAKEAGLEVETRTWQEMDPFYLQVMRDYTFQLNLIASILLVVILLAVSNTIFMSIMERTPEFGTLRAIGISKPEIIRTVLAEGLILGIISSVAGIALAYGVQVFLNTAVYIELPPPPSLTDPILLATELTPEAVLLYGGLIAIFCSAATILPSLKASSINIVSAIRHA